MNQGVIYSEEIMKVDKKEEDERIAKRPVYVSKMETPFYSVDTIEFDEDRGLAKTQKQIKTRTATKSENIEKFSPNVEMKPGDLILHRKFGAGKIKAVTDTTLIID